MANKNVRVTITTILEYPVEQHNPETCMLCGVVFGSAGAWSKKNRTNFGFSKKLGLINKQLLFNIYDRKCLDFACEECAEILMMQDDPFVYFINDLYKR